MPGKLNRNGSAATEGLDPRALLPSLSRAELERILRKRLDEGDQGLEELILSLHADKSDKRSPAAIVASLVGRHANGEYDCIDDPYGFACDLRRLYGRAADAVSRGEGLFAVRLLAGAIEGAAPHAFEGDDEEGEIMGAVEECFERLMGLAQSPESGQAALRELGTWALQSVDAQWARDGDSWDMVCLELAAAAARGEADVRAVLELCSRFTESPRAEWSWTYRAQRAALVSVGLLERAGDQMTRRAYVEDHLSLADIRMLAADEAMKARDYSRAIELSRDGVKIFREVDQDGSADEFAERLIDALDRAGDRDEATRELENLLIDSFSDDRFAALKKRHSKRDTWLATRDRVIAALEKNQHSGALATIYKADHMNERLLALAEEDEFTFREYLDTIGHAYPERAARFLKNEVERDLRRTANRDAYAHSAQSILRYGKYAGKKAAEALFDSLIAAYPARRAMREEFAKARQVGYP
jgi:hypothetical protein